MKTITDAKFEQLEAHIARTLTVVEVLLMFTADVADGDSDHALEAGRLLNMFMRELGLEKNYDNA